MSSTSDKSSQDHLNALSRKVIGLCLEVHRELGPGLLESAYEEALAFELSTCGLAFERQKEVPLRYKGAELGCSYRLDFVIEGELILELKAVSELQPIHHAQLLTYLRLEHRSLGLLINFNVPLLKDGIHRIAAGDLFKAPSSMIDKFLMFPLLFLGFLSSGVIRLGSSPA